MNAHHNEEVIVRSQEWETVMRLMIFYKAKKIMSFRDMVKILNNCQVIYFFLD